MDKFSGGIFFRKRRLNQGKIFKDFGFVKIIKFDETVTRVGFFRYLKRRGILDLKFREFQGPFLFF